MTDISTGAFRLKRIESCKSKPYYVADGERERAALAAAYADLVAAYGIRMPRRHWIMADVRRQMDAPGDSIVLRLDVKTCSESVDYDMLRRRLVAEGRLNPDTIATVDLSIAAYRQMGAQRGVPRGLCTSTALVEILLGQIDRLVQSMPGLQLYRRNIDDSIIFFDPAVAGGDARALFAKIEDMYRSIGMPLHDPDEYPYKGDIIDSKLNCRFPFLGYDISRRPEAEKSVWRIPDSVCMSRMFAIKDAFDRFLTRAEGKAVATDGRKLPSPLAELLGVLRLLMSNRTVTGHGRKVKCGMSFNYPLITTTEQLAAMDAYLQTQIDRVTSDRMPRGFMATGTRHTPEDTAAYIRRRCRKFGFVDGYTGYKFSRAW